MQSPSTNTNTTGAKICVCVRLRPMNETERQTQGAFECASRVDGKRLLLADPDKFSTDPLRQHRAQEREFRFDAVFGPDATEKEVQEMLGAEGLVDSLVRHGRNGTVFAYGPTGTGKTHTMMGTRERPGVMTQMTRALYERLAEMGDHETRVFISFMEIYNELIRDLLNPDRSGPLDLLEDEHGNVQVPSLSRVRVPNSNRILQLLQEGNARRTQEPTAANATSSRSHALLQISLWRNQMQHGKLFLIDLAGSERASQTQNQGQRLKESAAINRSLLALGNVINALSAANGRRRTFVNFRDSKLTRLLKDSLAGSAEGARTVLIAHITPSSLHYDETFNTLMYASRARRIELRIPVHTRRSSSADRPYSDALATLRREALKAGRIDIGHAASTGQLNEANSDNSTGNSSITAQTKIPPLILGGGTSSLVNSPSGQNRRKTLGALNEAGTRQQQQNAAVKLPRIGGNLFDSLREQHLGSSERQQRLRDRLLRANTEAFELEMNRQTRMAILEAYQNRQKAGAMSEEKDENFEQTMQKMHHELEENEKRLSELAETRQKVEAALRRGEQNMRALETRMRSIAKDSHQQQVIELLRTLAIQQAERSAIHSDFAIQSRRIRRQESQMKRIRRYERVADQLIEEAEMDDNERKNLFKEYRLLRGQISKLANAETYNGLPSWNAQIYERLQGVDDQHRWTSDSEKIGDFGKTYVVRRTRGTKKEATRTQLPELALPESRSES